jgi:DNA-binding transcriptional regulator YhcF (GntR family)
MSDKKTSPVSSLDPASAAPFYRQIYDRFCSAIAGGMLKPGDRIPSARALANELGLSRGTVDTAYSLLTAEGYIEARGQAGTTYAGSAGAPEYRRCAGACRQRRQSFPTRCDGRPGRAPPS